MRQPSIPNFSKINFLGNSIFSFLRTFLRHVSGYYYADECEVALQQHRCASNQRFRAHSHCFLKFRSDVWWMKPVLLYWKVCIVGKQIGYNGAVQQYLKQRSGTNLDRRRQSPTSCGCCWTARRLLDWYLLPIVRRNQLNQYALSGHQEWT